MNQKHIARSEEQLTFEGHHLLQKLLVRDSKRYEQLATRTTFTAIPIFHIVPEPIADWEIG